MPLVKPTFFFDIRKSTNFAVSRPENITPIEKGNDKENQIEDDIAGAIAEFPFTPVRQWNVENPSTSSFNRSSGSELYESPKSSANMSSSISIVPPPTPPNSRFCALKLFDSPLTPKSLLQSMKQGSQRSLRSNSRALARISPLNSQFSEELICNVSLKSDKNDNIINANHNPFTKEAVMKSVKRKRIHNRIQDIDSLGESMDEEDAPCKKVHLWKTAESRYDTEFHELGLIGNGQYGSVTQCLNRLDGCMYAIKRSSVPIAGSASEARALREVYAHAVLGHHEHVVRYFSAWADKGHMLIQNELCLGGSLGDLITRQGPMKWNDVKEMIGQVGSGIKYIHHCGLVHMDIKPGNIFICPPNDPPSYFDEDDSNSMQSSVTTYKIGDLGHVTVITEPTIEEGDCRYLSRELLAEDYGALRKADIFAFGMTIFEVCTATELPKNGPAWHSFRDGKLPPIPGFSKEFHKLVQSMLKPKFRNRPSMSSILKCEVLDHSDNAVIVDLKKELLAARMSAECLFKQLRDVRQQLEEEQSSKKRGFSERRLIGKKENRSMSFT